MYLETLSSALGGLAIIPSSRRRVLRSSRRLMRERVSKHNTRAIPDAEFGLITGIENDSRFRGGSRIDNGLRRVKSRGIVCIGIRQWRVRAADDAEQDPLDEEGYWQGDEGQQQLSDIEDMLELIAEAENLKRTESTEVGPGSFTTEEIEEQKAEKLRDELARHAKQQTEQRKQAEVMFSMAQRAYGRGVYDKSVELLEAALSNVPGSTNRGGEIQIWLAMAYEANNRHGDCIALYKRLEASHPNQQIRRQAANLRYILEAPKLKISKEEMVSIPIIERDYDRNSKSWSQKVRDRRRKPTAKSKDYLEDWLVWDPPRWERNPYFWVALTIWLTLVGISLMFQD